MMKDYKEYIDKFIALHSNTRWRVEDYGKNSKISTRQHNKAMRNLNMLYDEIHKDLDLAAKVYSELLLNENIDIQQCAAAGCLQLNIYITEAEATLERIIKTGHVMASRGSETILQNWRDKINQDKGCNRDESH